MRIIYCLLGFVVFGLILYFIIGDAFANKNWLDASGDWAWLVAIGLLVADVFLPIPTTIVVTVTGQKYGPILGGAIATLGSFSAGVVAYGFTRMLGARFASWLLGNELARAERFFRSGGALAVAGSRWLPLLPEAISCMAGLARMPFGKYCVALLCGSVPMCFAYASLAAVSDSEVVPLVLSMLLPVPTWWMVGWLFHRRASGRGDCVEPEPEKNRSILRSGGLL